MWNVRRSAACAVVLAVVAGCAPGDITRANEETLAVAARSVSANDDVSNARTLQAVLRWNALSATLAPSLSPNGPLPPFVEARLHAITNVAIHDALNGVRPRFARYADDGDVIPQADATAAVIAAGHAALLGATPPAAHAAATTAYDAEIAALRDDARHARDLEAIDAGIMIGERAAAAVLARRASDGTAGGAVAPYDQGAGAGDYRFTFPFNTPAFDFFGKGGFADATMWGTVVQTFVVNNGAQFRAPAPYGAANNAAAVQTAAYTADFNEVAALGCTGCAARSAEQTSIALFWVENSPPAWNRIARTLAAANGLDAWKTARLLALVQLAEFDGYTTALESKYYYNFWRPVTAVALAGTDGNPATSSVAGWQVLRFPTPPVPDYPSAHSVAGGAAAAVIRAILPQAASAPFAANSLTLPAVTRTFGNIDAAARENADSRVFVGYHFRHATDAGVTQGNQVGQYIAQHALLPGR